jgi:AcrR family transcriptional regulator
MSSKADQPARRAGPGRPRKTANGDKTPALGAASIHAAALALIDARGLHAFNIRDLATALGVAPAAIYWHVPNRSALVSGAMALALSGVAADLPTGPWKERLHALFARFRAALRSHPRLAPAVASELTYTTSVDSPMLEYVLDALVAAGFADDALVDAYNAVIAAMCGFVTLELSTAPTDAEADWEATCRAQIDAVDTRRFPTLGVHLPVLRNRAFMLRWVSGKRAPLDTGFEAWVDVFLRGLESRSRALRKTPR